MVTTDDFTLASGSQSPGTSRAAKPRSAPKSKRVDAVGFGFGDRALQGDAECFYLDLLTFLLLEPIPALDRSAAHSCLDTGSIGVDQGPADAAATRVAANPNRHPGALDPIPETSHWAAGHDRMVSTASPMAPETASGETSFSLDTGAAWRAQHAGGLSHGFTDPGMHSQAAGGCDMTVIHGS